MQIILNTLRDIEGVLGSFFVDETGKLLARDMPGVFDDATLSSASLRLSRLRAALEADAPSFDGCVARFGEHLLVLKPVATRTLCVLVPKGANLTALSMGTTLVARRLVGVPQEPERSAAAPLPNPAAPPPEHRSSLTPPAPRPPTPEQMPNAAGERPAARRFFRGRPVP
jgi:hypothetical protein